MANWAGQFIDWLGTKANLPDWGISELVGGGKTANTGRVGYSGGGIADDQRRRAWQNAITEGVGSRTVGDSNQHKGGSNQPQGNTGTVYRGGGGNYQSNRDRDITLGMIDQQIGAIDNSLNNLGATRNAAQNQINDAYNKGMDRLNQQQSRALSRYATKRSDTTRDFQHSTEDIDINSANKYRALQNLLGRAGAGRSSASANVVPYAVAQDASKSRGKVADTYSTNMRDLKTAEDETKESYNNNVQDLQEQKRNKEAALDNDIKSKESAYHSSRAELLGKRAQAAGGGWRQVQGAMAGDIAQKDAIDRALASLLDNYRNPVNVRDVKVSDPKLTNYANDLNGITVDDPNGTGYDTDTSGEYLARMKEEDKRKKQLA